MNLKDKEVKAGEFIEIYPDDTLVESVCYSKDIKEVILKFDQILFDYKVLNQYDFNMKYISRYPYIILDNSYNDYLILFYKQIFGDWKK